MYDHNYGSDCEASDKGNKYTQCDRSLLNPGHIDTEIQGIVTAFCASQYVIEQAISLGANFIITHEGIFYSHRGMQDCLLHDSVFLQKSRLIADSGIGIYRFHDTIHRNQPDRV